MPATYEPIATTTLTSAQATVTFSSIAATFTDLVLICNFGTSSTLRTGVMRFNSDSGNNYSYTNLSGNGTDATSFRGSSISGIYFEGQRIGDSTALQNMSITHIMNYTNTTTAKTILSRSGDASGYSEVTVGLWRGTSNAAITRIDLTRDNATNWSIDSTFTLYGIKAF